MNERSCVGCVFLYMQDHGYSNWTVTNTAVHCAQNKNSELAGGVEEPYNWLTPSGEDRWPATMHRRCELYANIGVTVRLDVDGEEKPADQLPAHPHFAAVIDLHRGTWT